MWQLLVAPPPLTETPALLYRVAGLSRSGQELYRRAGAVYGGRRCIGLLNTDDIMICLLPLCYLLYLSSKRHIIISSKL